MELDGKKIETTSTKRSQLPRRLQLLAGVLLALAIGLAVIAAFWRVHQWVHANQCGTQKVLSQVGEYFAAQEAAPAAVGR